MELSKMRITRVFLITRQPIIIGSDLVINFVDGLVIFIEHTPVSHYSYDNNGQKHYRRSLCRSFPAVTPIFLQSLLIHRVIVKYHDAFPLE